MKYLILALFALYIGGHHIIANDYGLQMARHFVGMMLVICIAIKLPGMVIDMLRPARHL